MAEISQKNNTANQLFIINRSEIVDRFDPEMILYNRKAHSFLYDVVELKKVLKKQPQYGANESGVERKTKTESRYIRITDIDEFGLLIDSIGVTAATIEDKYILKDNDLLFARSGATVGKAYLHSMVNVNYECFFAGYMIRFIVDQTKILPKFLFTYTQLNIYKSWVKAIQRAAGQPNINAEEYKSLPIPLAPIKVQKEIVSKIDKAYSLKQQKDAQAKKLLKNIDIFILKELGISLPEADNSQSKRMFVANFSDVVGLRFDPSYFKNTGKIESELFENVSLRKILFINKGQSITKEKITEGIFPVIAGGQSSPYSHNVSNFDGNIITISASGAYSGFVWYHNYPIFASDCIVLQSKNEKEVNTEFVYFVLKALQSEIYKMQQGAGQPHVYARDIEKMTIPVPQLIKQLDMLNHIQNIQQQIKVLQSEAVSILENAKAEVEKMILG